MISARDTSRGGLYIYFRNKYFFSNPGIEVRTSRDLRPGIWLISQRCVFVHVDLFISALRYLSKFVERARHPRGNILQVSAIGKTIHDIFFEGNESINKSQSRPYLLETRVCTLPTCAQHTKDKPRLSPSPSAFCTCTHYARTHARTHSHAFGVYMRWYF